MADTRIPLLGAPFTPYASYMKGAKDRAELDQMRAQADEAKGNVRNQQIAIMRNAAYNISEEQDPVRKQQKLERFKQIGPTWFPDRAADFAGLTMEDLDGWATAGTTPEQSLGMVKTQAEINTETARTGLVGAQTDDQRNQTYNRDRMTGSNIAVNNAQIGNYGASTANTYDEIRSRRGKDAAGVYGQLPDGWMMGPDGKASVIPGYTPPTSESGLKPPEGYRYTPDGRALEPIPGGPVAAKATGQDFAAQQALEKVDMTMGKIDQALGQVGPMTAGVGSYLSFIPGTGARDLEATLATVKANLGFNELAAMRAASPTGGALGQVTERELAFLQSTLAALDTAQSPAQLRENLLQVKTHYARWKAAMTQAGNPGVGSGILAPAGGPQPGQVEDGYRFKGGNPADPQNWEPAS